MNLKAKILMGIAMVFGLLCEVMPDWMLCLAVGIEIIGWCAYLISWIKEGK